MNDQETALPAEGAAAPAEAGGQHEQAAPAEQTTKPDGEGQGQAEDAADKEAKPEKTAEQREIERLRRGIDRRTRQLADARAQLGLTREPERPNNQATADDSEPLSLTRAQLKEFVTAEAAKLAPTLREQATEAERRQGVVESLAKTWGQDRFNELSSELDDVFGGLADRSGRPKPATEAIFEADEPAKVIEYLADPDNADEAESISRMGAVQAGKAIAKLEAKLATQPAKNKPQASKAPAPLEKISGQGSTSGAPDPVKDPKAWRAWRNEQERKGL